MPSDLDSTDGHPYYKERYENRDSCKISCSNLTNVVIPIGVQYLGANDYKDGSFSCDELESITVPSTVKSINYYWLYYTPALKTVNYYGSKEQWAVITSGDNVIRNYRGETKELTEVTIKYNYDPVHEEQERIAAEKAEQERIAAEKKAAEKKAEEERKAAEEKRIAEEKARAERKAAEEKKVQELTAKANKGDAQAQADLGAFYTHGGEFIAADYAKAFDLFSKAAAQGNPRGINGLGVCYQYGIGVQKNEKKAIEFYTKAAKLGFDKAQCNLGICYYNGYGVKQNYKKAVQYFEQAAEQGNSDAQFRLGLCYYYGEGVEKNLSKAIMLLKQSADAGNEDARRVLGR